MKLLATYFLLFIGVFILGTNASAQWKQSAGYNNSHSVRGFLGYAPYLLVDAATGGGSIDSLYASTDNGQNWVPFAPNGGVPLAAVLVGTSPNLVGTAAYALTGTTGLTGMLSYSSDFGKNWQMDTLGWPDKSSLASVLVTMGNTIYGTNGGVGVYQQTSPGAQWTPDTVGMTVGGTPLGVVSMIVSGTNIFCSAFLGGVFLSTNQGASWAQVNNGIPNQTGYFPGVSAFAISGSSLYAMIPHNGFSDTIYDFYRTTNNGQSWTLMNSTPLILGYSALQFVASGQNLFTAADAGIYVSGDNGATWSLANEGFPTFDPLYGGSGISSIIVSGENLVIGRGIYSEVWYRKLSEFAPSSVGSGNTPNSFSLSESYPNPVSSTSKINYSLSKDGIASLTLFDVTGKQVASLSNGTQITGDHTATFDGSVLPAGMYFYRLTTEEGSIGHWLQLIK